MGSNPQFITRRQAQTIGLPAKHVAFAPTLEKAGLVTTSAGGSATQNNFNTQLTTDATAGEYATGVVPLVADQTPEGLVIAYVICNVSQAIGNLAEGIEWGLIDDTEQDNQHAAYFRPNAGNSTAGNVRVNVGGVANDGTVTYPTINDQHHLYSVVVDFDAGETRFHIDTNPLTDDPDATIAATPNAVKFPGAGIRSNTTDANELVRLRYAGVAYTP